MPVKKISSRTNAENEWRMPGRSLVHALGEVHDAEASAAAISAETTTLAEQLRLVTGLHAVHLAPTDHAPAILARLRECGALLDTSDDGEVAQAQQATVAGSTGCTSWRSR